ncbi:MAG: hypothetical protein HY372_03885 [Candidatus Andersenbacteria bacterium]|nr:hypothetical protein [Candidatus Andersenbacteria bacterium]
MRYSLSLFLCLLGAAALLSLARPMNPAASTPASALSRAHPAAAIDQNAANNIRRTMAACEEDGAQNECYQRAAGQFFSVFGLRPTLELLAQNEQYPEVYARCHEVTHYLARHEFAQVNNAPQAYAACDSTCHGGCYHGVMEAHLKNLAGQADQPTLAQHFTVMCGQLDDYDRPILYYECLHGLGHAAMFVTDTDLHRSLAMCDLLPDEDSQGRCYSGVFMENSSSSTNLDHPSRYLKADDPNYPCNNLAERYQQICYRYQSSHFALLANHNWDAVGQLCAGVPTKYQSDCFRTIGTNQVGFTRDLRVWAANCAKMPPDQQAICTKGVITSLAYRFVGETQTAEDFCHLAKPEHQQSCLIQLGVTIRDWSTDRGAQQAWCNQLTSPTFQHWCQQGLSNPSF